MAERPGTARLQWHQVRTLYRRELRAALRERTILINSILIPVFLYPFMLWAMFTAMTFVMGQTEGITSQVLLKEWPAGHPGLRKALQRDERLAFLHFSGDAAEAKAQINDGRADALLEFLPATGPAGGLRNNFEARITCNRTRDASVRAREYLGEVIQDYRSGWLTREARRRDVDSGRWEGFTLAIRNVASGRQLGAFLLGMLAPVIFVTMVAVGCFYPAVDALAGERERQTWETLMSTAASRRSIVTAKYLYVVTLGGFAGLLNLMAVLLTAKPVFGPLLAKAGKSVVFTLSPGAIPVAVLAALLLAGFVAAGMMVLAAFARTFKEGQAMITPFYMMVLIPVVMLQAPGLKLTPVLALVPVANLTLMVREAVSGNFPLGSILLTAAVSVVLIALLLRLAAFILRFEDVVLGSYNGSLFKLLREKVFSRRRPAGAGAPEPEP